MEDAITILENKAIGWKVNSISGCFDFHFKVVSVSGIKGALFANYLVLCYLWRKFYLTLSQQYNTYTPIFPNTHLATQILFLETLLMVQLFTMNFFLCCYCLRQILLSLNIIFLSWISVMEKILNQILWTEYFFS